MALHSLQISGAGLLTDCHVSGFQEPNAAMLT